jgi:toxin ParE1/3/4
MPNLYRLSKAAEADIKAIYAFTEERWSKQQARAYGDGLFDAFELIAAHPRIAPERRTISPPVRLHRRDSHLIINREVADGVLIIAIPHFRQSWQDHFDFSA